MNAMPLTTISRNICFGGVQATYSHDSPETGTTMRFGVFLPPQASAETPVPVLYWLSGLTCTEENFIVKAGAQRIAAELGLAIVAPDTSPRGLELPGEADSWDFGRGAGFYVDATQAPWALALPHVFLCHGGTPLAGRLPFPDRPDALGHLRPLDGRPRGTDHRPAKSPGLQVGLGLRPDRLSDALSLG
jgi:hypothetical protein